MASIKPGRDAGPADIEDLAGRLKFSFSTGHIWLGEERMILIHKAAFSSLRKELVDSLGVERARGLLTRMGYAAGLRDADLVRKLYPDSSDSDIIMCGPLLHTLQGVAKVEPVRLDVDIANGRFFADIRWLNSFESGLHRDLFGIEPGPCCWMQVGYASGFVSGILGKASLFKETSCGGEVCCITGKPQEDWAPEEAEELLRYYRADPLADQLLDLQHQVRSLRYSIDEAMEPRDLVGASPAFRNAWELLRKAAKSQITVLLLGETGVGKEMFARALHKASSRAKAPFIAVNCGALPEQLVESELFGVQQGAYTGAQQSRPGRFERAHGGTLFLDEVAELPLSAQTKLLRVLQEGEVERVGDSQTRKVDVRVVAATNVDLQKAVADGRFRKDLFYRLNVFPVTIAPLQERKEDIPLLVRRFIDKYASREIKRVAGLTDKAMQALKNYAWPGNVRELENMVERGVLLAHSDGLIDVADLFSVVPAEAEAATSPDRQGKLRCGDKETLDHFVDYFLRQGMSLEDVETSLMEAVLERNDQNVTAAARQLGVTRPQLRYRLKHRLGAEVEEG